MSGQRGGAGQRQPDACDVPWCDESAGGHTDDGHIGYLLTEITDGQYPAGPTTLQFMLVGKDGKHPRAALVLVPARGLRHISVVLSPMQLDRLSDAIHAAERRVA